MNTKFSAPLLMIVGTLLVLGTVVVVTNPTIVVKKPFSFAAGDFPLRYVGSTPFQIQLAWDAVPGATQYAVERSTDSYFTSVSAFVLPGSITGYGDNDYPPTDGWRRFASLNVNARKLDPGKKYYYRVAATTDNGRVVSNAISARLSGPKRGYPGDLWADIEIGQQNFFTYSFIKPTERVPMRWGGLVVDKTANPNRVYLADVGANRVLGFRGIGSCSSSGAACATDSQCGAGGTCNLKPDTATAQVVMGQPNFSLSACNGDATQQSYPDSAPAGKGSLCFNEPGVTSPGEVVTSLNMAIDTKSNLYVPDPFNHRILMYKDPMLVASFTGTKQALAVWGQPDFSGNTCNYGNVVSRKSLCLLAHTSVAIDNKNNLWIVDGVNNRVLRFPYDANNGYAINAADVVLGQDNFNTRYAPSDGFPDTNSYLFTPVAVAVDAGGNVYVIDRPLFAALSLPPRILKWSASAIATIKKNSTNPALKRISVDATEILAVGPEIGLKLAYDAKRNGLWFGGFQSPDGLLKMYDLSNGVITRAIGPTAHLTGISVDVDGNVYVTASNEPVSFRRYRAVDVNQSSPNNPVEAQFEPVLRLQDSEIQGSPEQLSGFTGMAISGNQLILADINHVRYWDNYSSLTSGQPANGYIALSTGINHYFLFGSPRTDSAGRLWVSSLGAFKQFPDERGTSGFLRAYQGPFQGSAQTVSYNNGVTQGTMPLVKTIAIDKLKTKEGNYITSTFAPPIRFTPIGDGNRMWLATSNGRVLRIVNIDGGEDPAREPYVDVVLGRKSITDTLDCKDTPNTSNEKLCVPLNVRLDPDGNVWVLERSTQTSPDDGGTRLLRFDAASIPTNASTTIFGISGSVMYDDDSFIPVFDAFGRMIAGMNSYTGSRLPLVYLNYRKEKLPQLSLGDVTSYVIDSMFDPQGNLYIGDWNWGRVLIFKTPFSGFKPGS